MNNDKRSRICCHDEHADDLVFTVFFPLFYFFFSNDNLMKLVNEEIIIVLGESKVLQYFSNMKDSWADPFAFAEIVKVTYQTGL